MDKVIKLQPSLLAADFSRLGEEANHAMKAGAHGLHADIMDGQFVPPITYGADIVAAVVKATGAFVDAHLMIVEPENQVEAFVNAGVGAITIHAETCPHLHRVLGMIKDFGVEAGVALNPATQIKDTLRYVLPLLDRVLIMTVNPGWGGQSFIPEGLQKVKKTADFLKKHGSSAVIQVDGGVSPKTAPALVENGATELVAGSAVFKGDIDKNVTAILDAVSHE